MERDSVATKLARSARILLALGLAGPVAAQIDVNGGTQSLVWTRNCATSELFRNNTGLPLAGLWIAINNDGTTNPPEVRVITVHNQGGGLTWDVDDNEDGDNDDAGEADGVDSTPTGLATGWHRVQARNDADRIVAGQNFTLVLCDSAGGSLSGRTITLIPIGPQGGTGGDGGFRTQPSLGLSNFAPSGSSTLDPAGAPPASTSFTLLVRNTSSNHSIRKIRLTPPGGVSIQSVTASGGGMYDMPTRTVIWPTPIVPGGSEQVSVTVDTLVSPLVTSIVFDVTEFISLAPGVPSLPSWGLALLGLGALLGLAWLLRRS